MKSPNVMEKINNITIYLNKIVGENNLDKIKDDENNNLEFINKAQTEIIKNNKNIAKILVHVILELKPKIIMLEADFIAELRLLEPISKEEIESNLDEILTGVGYKMSYLISFITDNMIKQPIVVPPSITIEEKEKKSS